MEFATKYSKKSDDYTSEVGKPTLENYHFQFDDKGHKNIVPDGTYVEVYERIQADRDSTDINVLMKRFALGDTEALNIKKGIYVDARNMPKTMADVFAKGLEAEEYFNGLPVEVKEMFENSYSVFYTEMGSKSFDEKIEKYNDRFVDHSFDIVESEVIKDE